MTDREFTRRLEILERNNRRLNRVAAAAIALAAALGVTYAVSCSSDRNPVDVESSGQRITAREFDVVDSAGRVRVQMAVNCNPATDCRPEVRLFDRDGKPLTSIGAGALSVSGEKETASLQGGRLQFSVGSKGSKPKVTAQVGSGSGGGGLLSLTGDNESYVRVNANSPSIELRDSQGYVMDLGAVDLTTVISGRTSQTTADSIVMFANDSKHHLIWRAP
jgi:hypothetical protein